ncbi:unnamed protein product [Rotaria sp. Silwood2]|nr:unnamed protein product [Rotaria sp. Silwood2]CAF3515646.1 unnamed protein product [Rotaria sp. Silwood2]CAF4596262.1 unnamed protein product [Rotaria sp. Silwood2]CAF4719184.1 unnamed protein product [Rotaria sp. Silwood2]
MRICYYKKKQRAPKYTEEQLQEILIRAHRLYRLFSKGDYELLMDDEKHFLLHNESALANRGFYSSDTNTTTPYVKFKRTKKFEQK